MEVTVQDSFPDSPQSPLRLGVASGSIARFRYGAALFANPSLKVVSIVDSDPRRLRTWAREFGKETSLFTNLKEMLEFSETNPSPPDTILLDAPLSDRPAALEAIFAAGTCRGVLCPPPFSPTLEETDELLKQANEARVTLFPALPRRHDPIFKQALELAKSGMLGTLLQLRCDWSFPFSHLLGVELGADLHADHWNSLLPYIATQTADTCRACFGETLSVSADIDSFEASALGNSRKPADTANLLATLLLSHAEGSSSCHFSRSRSVQSHERYIFAGDTGSLELIVSSVSQDPAWLPSLILHENGQRPQIVPPPAHYLPDDNAPYLRNAEMLSRFVEAVLANAENLVQDRTARACQETVQAAYMAHEEKRKMALPLRRTAAPKSRIAR